MTDELRLIPALREHHADFVRFFAGLDLDDPVPDSERWSAEMAPGTFFLADGDALVGYAFFEVYGSLGYVRHVVTAPEAQRRGVGRALMRELASRLRDAGATRWELNVKRDNRAAIGLYERCGMQVQYTTHVVRIDWSAVPRLPSAQQPVLARIVSPDHDCAVEAAFRLPDGKVARLRSLQGMILMQLVEGESVVAFARFDPRFPGCFPFHVARSELTRHLLEAVAPHGHASDRWIQLVIEDDDDTAALLLGVGARRTLEIVHMGGAIPAD